MLNKILILTLLVFSLSAEIVTRAAIDIGSGNTRMLIAEVDTEKREIIQKLFSDFKTIELRRDLAFSADNAFSQDIENQLTETLIAFHQKDAKYNPQSWVAIATSSLRTATNGKEFAERVSKNSGVEIKIIPQLEEGFLAFAGVVAVSHLNPEELVVWDQGSGSFQITSMVNGKLEMYGTEFAVVPLIDYLFTLRNQTYSNEINPISRDEMEMLISHIHALPESPLWLVNPNKKFFFKGLGTVLCNRINKDHIKKEDLYHLICELCGKTDQELSALESRNTKELLISLIYLYAIMDHCHIDTIAKFPYITSGSCEGVVVTPEYWEN